MKQLLILVVSIFLTISATAASKDSVSYAIWDLSTDSVIDEKNINKIKPMASITKLMTVLVVTRLGVDMDELVTVTGREGSSRITRGQRVTRFELAELALVNSDNLAARTLSETSGIPYDDFIKMMNDLAREMAMSSTQYVDSTGLLPGNVSTPDDLKILVTQVSENAIFNRAAMLPGTVSVRKKHTTFNANTNWLVGKLTILAAKTGTTNAAGRCLTMMFSKNGHQYLLVVLGARHAQERQILVQNLIDKIN